MGCGAATRIPVRFGHLWRDWRSAALLSLLLLALVPFRAQAASDSGAEQHLTELVGRERANAGLHGLAVSGDLVDVARRHAAHMAADGRLFHNPNLGREVSGWEVVGENVGRGSDVDSIHAALMGSPSHRHNILDARFTQIGVGVEAAGGELWVVQVFRRPAAAAAPAPAPAPHVAPVANATAPARAPAPPPPRSTTPPTTTAPATQAVAAPAPQPALRPPVDGLPAGPTRPAAEVLATPALALAVPAIPDAVKLAAALLVLVLGAQVVTLRRLQLV